MPKRASRILRTMASDVQGIRDGIVLSRRDSDAEQNSAVGACSEDHIFRGIQMRNSVGGAMMQMRCIINLETLNHFTELDRSGSLYTFNWRFSLPHEWLHSCMFRSALARKFPLSGARRYSKAATMSLKVCPGQMRQMYTANVGNGRLSRPKMPRCSTKILWTWADGRSTSSWS